MKNEKPMKSKVNIIEKIIWRTKYRELFQNFEYDVAKLKMLLHDKEISNYYKNNKNEIIDLVKQYSELLLDCNSNMLNMLLISSKQILQM